MDVRYKTWRSTYPKVYPEITVEDVDKKFADFEEMTKDIKEGIEKYNNKDKKFIIAKDEDEYVGFVIASKTSGEPREIKALYVLEGYQGQGIGKRLINSALSWLDATKTAVILEVVSTNNPAINFYERRGFVKSRDLPTPPKDQAPDGIPIPHIEMVRKPASIE